MRIRYAFQLPKFDKAEYAKRMSDILSERTRAAAEIWIKSTAVALIPVWSGASLGTFLHLARSINYNLPITPSATAASYRNGVTYGLRRSGPSEPLSYGKDGRWTFEYQTRLKHLIFNEANNANVTRDPAVFSRLLSPGPYGFQEKGQIAFEAFAQTVRPPSPMDSIKTTSLRG